MDLVGDEREEERKGSALGIEQVSMSWFPLFSLVSGFSFTCLSNGWRW